MAPEAEAEEEAQVLRELEGVGNARSGRLVTTSIDARKETRIPCRNPS